MDNYINNAQKFLADWIENLDVDLFIQQYESLNHEAHSDSILLDDEYLESYILLYKTRALLGNNRVFIEAYKKSYTDYLNLENSSCSFRIGESKIASLYKNTINSVDKNRDKLFIHDLNRSNLNSLIKEVTLTVNRDKFNSYNNNELNAA